MRRAFSILLLTALITTAAGGMLCFAGSRVITVPQKEYSVADTQKPFSLNVRYSGDLAYSSDRPSVATVTADGKVTIRGKGRATITVSAKDDPELYETIGVKVSGYRATNGKLAESDWNYDKRPGDSGGLESAVFKYEYRPDTTYYNWAFIIRCNDPVVADKAATAVRYIISNRNFGYESIKPTSQEAVISRGAIYRTVVKVTGKNPSKKQLKKIRTIKKKADTSCLPTLLAGYWLYYEMSAKKDLKWIYPYNSKSYKYDFGEVNVEYHQLESVIKQVNKEYRRAGKQEPFTIIYVADSRRRSFFAPKNIKKNLKRGDIICSCPNTAHEGHTAMMM